MKIERIVKSFLVRGIQIVENADLIIVIFLIVSVLVLHFINLSLNQEISSMSINQARMEKELEKIREENLALENKILELASLKNIEVRAERLGYTEDNVIYLK